MQIFTGNDKTYATQENAIKAANKVAPSLLDETTWSMGVTPEGRFFVVLHGREHLQLAHKGLRIAAIS